MGIGHMYNYMLKLTKNIYFLVEKLRIEKKYKPKSNYANRYRKYVDILTRENLSSI